MTNNEVLILKSIIKPGKYLAQLNGQSLSVKSIITPGLIELYYVECFDNRTNSATVLHISNINTEDVYLLPIRRTLKSYIDWISQ